ncbi:serine/threonine-protein kinase 11-interacting protein isoform X1 [Gouania willdenowi]|uniref:Serine/threonine-protein kinase 11-interacting protein n=1 Tax=Gouania willdenowi TaxID=441366 RepID=A0A8C5HEZ8_GOUWI|nr:serine/threonine-protein kinase 11-interacting protein isoform X1 [Gouania willdenowi]XP_028322828.1 serine/threonine-protein kinase 11-interacting protein isoform X1 [Gouania willdenowi]
MAVSHPGQSSLVHSLATLLRDKGDVVLDGSSTLTLSASSLQHLTRLFEMYLLSRSQQHGFLALPSHPADTASLLQLQFLFDVLQKTISLKLINPTRTKLQSGVKIFPFKSLKCLELKGVPPHCLEGLRGIYSQLEVLTCSKSLSSLEELLSLCGGDLSSALPWLELLTLNFSYNFIVGLDQSLSLLNVLKSLDLSHNKIQECAEFLKPLSELEHLNLGYNCLQRAPTLGSAARAKLLTLNLRNNELETINGVEQLSSLRHLDLAYNLLLEHSQLAPLSLLHCLSTLNLEGNPLFFQKTHRTCTVPHLSPKAASLRFRLDAATLSSSELSVLPKPGPAQTLPAVATPSERLNHELSSGAGELSDSQSVGDAIVSSFRKKKSRSKVKVRRASISEPSDNDYESRTLTLAQEIVLPHQQEIERMSSFREQLGEDWLRYQHHLDGASPSTISSVPANQAEALPNIVPATTLHPPGQKQSSSSSLEVQDVVSSPLIPTETKVEISDIEMVLETESTLLWPSHGTGTVTGMTNSTLEDPTENGHEGGVSPQSPRSERAASAVAHHEDEVELGVDLCPPLLMGVLSDEDRRGQEELKNRAKVFLCIKQGLVVEMDVQHGQERRRLELDSLERVETTEAAWTHGDTETFLPAVKLYFNYISRDKRKRCYVFLDDDPQQAQQALLDILSHVVEENQRRDSALGPSRVQLQCLRCRSEFSQGTDGEGKMMLPKGVEERKREEWAEAEGHDDVEGILKICPECGSDHVVQVHSAPKCSTPICDSEDEPPTCDPKKDQHTDANADADLIQERSTTVEEPAFVTAQGSCFYIGDSPGNTSSLLYNTEYQSKEDLAGSYHYSITGATPPQVQTQPVVPYSPDDLDLLSEDYEVVDHRLKLFLDVEVFEEEEELRCFLKMSAVKFGEPGEVPSLMVVSNQRIYFLEMTSDGRGHLSDWLQKKESYSIVELSYLEVGLASQTIHIEFGELGGVAYTLLVGDSVRCKRFFSTLTGIVRELAHKAESKLKSISTTRLTPQHHLWPLVCDDIQEDVEDGQLQFFYILAFVLQEDFWTPLTLLATRETLYLLHEDHQWRKSVAAESESGDPTSGSVAVLETLPISCVSSVVVWPDHQRRVDIKLYDETVKQERTWCVRSESSELLQGLLAWVRTQWEGMFSVRLQEDKAPA